MQTEWIYTFPQPRQSNNPVQLDHSNQPLATLTENLYYHLLQDALMNINGECNTSQLCLSSTCPQKHGGEVLRSQPTHRLLTPALTVVLTHNTNRGVQRTVSAAAQRAAKGSVWHTRGKISLFVCTAPQLEANNRLLLRQLQVLLRDTHTHTTCLWRGEIVLHPQACFTGEENWSTKRFRVKMVYKRMGTICYSTRKEIVKSYRKCLCFIYIVYLIRVFNHGSARFWFFSCKITVRLKSVTFIWIYNI